MYQPKPSDIPPIPFTADAYAKLQADFAELTEKRVAVMERVRVAREMGDLSENGAYTYGKMELGAVNRELVRVRHLLKHGVIVSSAGKGRVDFGSTVTVKNEAGKELTYMLVSIHESNPTAGKLSTESPLGAALLGKKVGDEVEAETPSGVKKYVILNIS